LDSDTETRLYGKWFQNGKRSGITIRKKQDKIRIVDNNVQKRRKDKEHRRGADPTIRIFLQETGHQSN
jgi:hypothetical protein